jgi:hypothetical protein
VLESEADRLSMVKAGGETFSTGLPEKLWLIFDQETIDATLGDFTVEDTGPQGLGRSSDVALHGLVKQSVVTRDADGAKYAVKRLKPDGTGMTLVVFAE